MALMACEYATSSGNVTVEWNKNETSLVEGDLPCDCQVLKNGSLLFNNITSNDVGKYTCVARVASEQHDCSAVLNGKIISIIIGLYCGGIFVYAYRGKRLQYVFYLFGRKSYGKSMLAFLNCPGWFIKLLILNKIPGCQTEQFICSKLPTEGCHYPCQQCTYLCFRDSLRKFLLYNTQENIHTQVILRQCN